MKHRPIFLAGILCLTFTTACQTNARKQEAAVNDAATERKPNIIYILADDLGYADLGCYGQQVIPTPALDSMAAEGILFTQHYAGSTVCAPSRGSLMTGRDTGHGRVRGNYETGPYGFGAGLALHKEDITIAEVLKRGGYYTGIIGKWGLGMNGTTGSPNKKGFDYFYGFLNQGHAHYQFPEYLWRNTEKVSIPENMNNARSQFTGDLFTSEALTFIEQHREGPFFLYLSYTTPHAELLVPDDTIFQSFKGNFNEEPFVRSGSGSNGKSGFGAYHSQEYPKAAYAAMISRLDLDIKKITDKLKTMGLDKNTVLVFSSDNGPHYEGGADPGHFNSNGKLRGGKRDLYEGGIRVPFIVRWPGTINPRQVSDHISANWDMMATFADIAGVDISNIETEGHSLYPLLLGQTNRQQRHEYLYWEFHEGTYTHQAIRKGPWKGVRKDPDGALELFNLQTDISEERDIAGEHPGVVRELKELLSAGRTPHPLWQLKRSENKESSGKP